MGKARRWTLHQRFTLEANGPGLGEGVSVEVVAVEDALLREDVRHHLSAVFEELQHSADSIHALNRLARRLGLDDDTSTTKGEQGGDA